MKRRKWIAAALIASAAAATAALLLPRLSGTGYSDTGYKQRVLADSAAKEGQGIVYREFSCNSPQVAPISCPGGRDVVRLVESVEGAAPYEGRYALAFEARNGDHSSPDDQAKTRTHVELSETPKQRKGRTLYYGGAVMFARGFHTDFGQGWFIVRQLHDCYEPGHSPSVQLSLSPSGLLRARHQLAKLNNPGKTLTKDLSTGFNVEVPANQGRWITYVIAVKASKKAGGYVELWVDGKAMGHSDGPTLYSNSHACSTGGWFVDRFGTYRDDSPTGYTSVVYQDAIRVDDQLDGAAPWAAKENG